MKVKKDVKYIIKRIIIGVGVALVLASINKCNVYAESINVLFDRQPSISFTNSGYDFLAFKSPYSNNNYNYKFSFDIPENNRYYIIFYNQNLDIYLYMFFNSYEIYDNVDISNLKIVWSEDYNTWLYNYSCTDSTSSSSTTCNDGLADISGLEYGYYLTNSSSIDFSSFSKGNLVKYDSPINNEYFYSYYGTADGNSSLFSNFTIYESNLNSLYINGIEQQIPLPNGYSELDISNYDGVYFVPKNYNNVQIETVGNVNFMDFNYWFKGSIKYGYFPLEYPPKIVSDYQVRSSITDFEYVDSILPLYENTDMTGYQYYSYFIYNSQKGQETKIRYNSTLFNAFLIEDMFTYVNDNVCTINRNNENMCFKVDFQSPLDNYWLDGFQEGGDEFNDGYAGGKRKIDAYLDLLKIPFDFLRSLNRNSCQPISLTIPFTNNSITLNCLSPLFHRVLGNFYYVLFYIVSGFYVYRITIMNVDTFTDVIDPNDDKLEVIDL